MKKLICLEWDKFMMRPHLVGIIIANIVVLLLSVFSSIIMPSGTQMPGALRGQAMQLDTITIATMLTKAVLLVWEAVFISLIIISEFQNKTIDMLFTYPVNRTKLFLAKILLICAMTIGFYIGSFVFQNACIFILGNQFEFVTYSFQNVFQQSISIISAVFIGLLPLSIGIMKQSSIATIVSSLIIVAIASNTQGAAAGLISIPIFSVALGICGIVTSIVVIRKTLVSDMCH